jgi:beta-glucosidase-like glycosyl hydrolase
MALGATNDTLLTYQMAADIALQLKRLGIHINFAPVIDINSNPLNPVIGSRAFGQDREMVYRHGIAYTKGLQDNGILACAKHFPGHGDTYEDSHLTLPLVQHSANRIDSIELYPFKALFSEGVAGVMVAHLKIPSLESDTLLPSSLSPRIVSQKLFGELRFNGLAITDALNMKGVSDYFDPVDANIRSLLAGNDILLFPGEIENTIKKIDKLIKDGHIPEEIINIKCKKVLMAKYLAGLNRYKPVSIEGIYSDLNQPHSQVLNRNIKKKPLRLFTMKTTLLFHLNDSIRRIAYIEIGSNKGVLFVSTRLYTSIHTFTINAYDDQTEFDILLTELSLTIWLLLAIILSIAGLQTGLG